MGPLLGEGTLHTPYSCLSHDTFQTNNHNHSNVIKGLVSRNDYWKYKTYKNVGIFHKDAILIRHGPFTRESYPTYPCSCLSQGTFQINKHNHIKQIDAAYPEIRGIRLYRFLIIAFLSTSKKKVCIKTLGFCHNEDILALHGPIT